MTDYSIRNCSEKSETRQTPRCHHATTTAAIHAVVIPTRRKYVPVSE